MLSYISYPIKKYIDYRNKKREKYIRQKRYHQINMNSSISTPVLASFMAVSSGSFNNGEKLAWGSCRDDLIRHGIECGVSYYTSESHYGECWYFYLTLHTQEDISLMKLLFPNTKLMMGDDIKMVWE